MSPRSVRDALEEDILDYDEDRNDPSHETHNFDNSPEGEYASSVKHFARKLYSLIFQETRQQKDYREFLGSASEDGRVTLQYEVDASFSNQFFYGVQKALNQLTDIKNVYLYSTYGRAPPSKHRIQIKPDSRDEKSWAYVYTDATFFVHYKGEPFVVMTCWGHETVWVEITANKKEDKEDNTLANELLVQLVQHTKSSLYKNQTITLIDGVLDFQDIEKKVWGNVIVEDIIQREIKENITFPIHNKDLFVKHHLPWRRNVLLYGEPGTGKTLLCKVLASTQEYTVFWATARSISRCRHITLLFDAARQLAPSLIVFEDIDLLGTSRDIAQSELLGELLSQLDGAEQNDGLFVIATTNRPHVMDKALIDRPARLDCKLHVTYENRELRKCLLELFSKDKPLELDLDHLANITVKTTPAQMQEAIIATSIKALNQKTTLKTEDVAKVLQQYKTVKGQEVS
ncbi:MAG: ATP-binding protein [Candidatus Blackburnbacteria bacterium]|nr:ATP-binding protein [Candidatus Blackburnbacteria bacterium]